MSPTKRMIVVGLASLALAGIAAAPADADPASPDQGCHGFYTTQAKQLSGDRRNPGHRNRRPRPLGRRSG